ncbi:helix-turn-helix domain-containing protein [Embleya sp. NPDC001921]
MPCAARTRSYWRERRGVSQRELAIRLGRSASWMRKVESGERALERLPVLDAVAEALRVDVRVLSGRELVRDGDMCADGVEVAAIRRALERYDHRLAADAGAVVDRGRLRIGGGCGSGCITCGWRSRAPTTARWVGRCRI